MARKLILNNINNYKNEMMENTALKEKPIYPIRTAAEILGISVHTLRMYEREGLVLPHNSSGNQRAYSEKDIERIRCIRKAINESKISINGIKTIYSLIPCWDVVGCSEEDRKKCGAFQGHSQPCWTYNHPGTTCENRDCRDCDVYKNYAACGNIKNLIIKTSGIE